MAKQGEIDYLRNLEESNLVHALRKPFTGAETPRYIVEIGTVMSLLPPPPARLLDIGCGTGWTSVFFARTGYEVVGVDIAPDMIRYANEKQEQEKIANLRFQVCDYEEMAFDNEFDGVVFYDSLHHAVNEELAIRCAYRALKPHGVCVAAEPGKGHQDAPHSLAAVRKFNVTEKDMPPEKIIALGRQAGFGRSDIFPHAFDLHGVVFTENNGLDPRTAKQPVHPNPLRRLLGKLKSAIRSYWADPEKARFLKIAQSGGFPRVVGLLSNVQYSGLVRLVKEPPCETVALRSAA